MTFPFPKSLTSVPSTPVPGTLLLLGILFVLSAKAEDPGVTLHIFAGGAGERTNVLRSELDRYEHVHTGIKVLYNTGGATSELQRRYLSTLLEARDTGYDAFVVDVVNPAEYAAAGWIEPLDSYLGGPAGSSLDAYLPSERQVNVVDGKVFALPWVTDAQFLFYRSDLLKKYGLRPPLDWDELAADAQRVVAGEKDPQLFGLSIQGAPIEGPVCTFLIPYWSQGRELLDHGHLSLDRPAALATFRLWRRLLESGVLPAGTAETKTGDTTNEFKAGHAVFAINWGSSWEAAEHAPDTQVRGRTGIAQLPAVPGGVSVSSTGGWQWAVSAFSTHKPEAVALIRFLTSRAEVKSLAMQTSVFPALEDLYSDPDFEARIPWLVLAREVFHSAKPRPITPRYSEVSDVLRTTTSAVLGGSITPEAGVDEIQGSLGRVLR